MLSTSPKPLMTMSPPSEASWIAMALPRPLVEPVTKQRFPFRPPSEGTVSFLRFASDMLTGCWTEPGVGRDAGTALVL